MESDDNDRVKVKEQAILNAAYLMYREMEEVEAQSGGDIEEMSMDFYMGLLLPIYNACKAHDKARRKLYKEVVKKDYGFCPICGGKGVGCERSSNGNTQCENGHSYPHSHRVYKKG